MKRRHLQELLGDEQEPFILQTFLDEKRSLLLHHRKLRGVPQPTTTATTTSPHASKTTVPLLHQAAVRIHGHHPHNKAKMGVIITMLRWRRRRRKERRRKNTIPPRLVTFSLLKRFLHRKLRRGFRTNDEDDEDDEDESSRVSVKDVLSFRWDSSIEEYGEQEEEMEEDSINVQHGNSSEPLPPCCLGSPESPKTDRMMPEIMAGTIDGGGEGREMEKQCKHAEEEKDQYSPVSVLDPPFEDHLGSCSHHQEVEDEELVAEVEEAKQVMQMSVVRVDVEIHAAMQRSRKQLFSKAKRADSLDGLELEPFDLEKEISRLEEEHARREDDECLLGPSQLISDLVAEELDARSGVAEVACVEEEVRRRLKGWREVEENTIDMMVELDLSRESGDGWRRTKEEEVWDVAGGIELRILWVLMEEVADEFVVLT